MKKTQYLKIIIYIIVFAGLGYLAFSFNKTENIVEKISKLDIGSNRKEASEEFKYLNTKINADILQNEKFKNLSVILNEDELKTIKDKKNQPINNITPNNGQTPGNSGEIDLTKIEKRNSNPFKPF